MPFYGNFSDADYKVSGSLSEEGVRTLSLTTTYKLTGDGKNQAITALGKITLGSTQDGLKCNGGSITYLGEQLWEVTEQFVGVASTNTFYIARASAGQEPIETHDDFTDVLAGTPDSPLNEAVFDTDSEEAKFSHWPANAPHKLGGVSEYLVPSVEVQEVILSSNMNWSTKSNDVGTISTPATRPLFSGNRNWLVSGYEQEFHQGYTKTTVTYRLSGKGGWNVKIYD